MNDWKPWLNPMPVPEETRNKWAEEQVEGGIDRTACLGFTVSGDSLVVTIWSEGGIPISQYDCLIRRHRFVGELPPKKT